MDHLEEVQENITQMVEECRDLRTEHEHSIDLKLNQTMTELTILNAIFLPGQFLASVFGMNFKYNMFGINWRFGYLFFWIICFTSWILLAIYFRYKYYR